MKLCLLPPLTRTVATVAAVSLLTLGTVYGRVVLQITPTLTISEEYTDNLLSTGTNKQEEFITAYALGFSIAMMDTNLQLYLNYSPTYQDYRNLDDRDRLAHILSVESEFRPTKHTMLEARLSYSGNSNDYEGEGNENRAEASGETRVSRHTVLTYGHTYSDRFDEQVRTGEFTAHTVNTTEMGVSHQFGEKDTLEAGVTYTSDRYDDDNADEYDKLAPEATLTYWLTPENGLAFNVGYQQKDFQDDSDDIRVYSGYAQYIKRVSKTLDWFLKYRHAYSETDAFSHHIFHPSVGVDWDISEDSGITAGIGVLFHDWSNNNDDEPDPFLELDAFKRFEFSRRTALTITGESDYSSSDDDASSLGYNTKYQVGGELEHLFLKTLSGSVFGSYARAEFHETESDRTDDTAVLGAGLSWMPLKWLRLSLNYSFTDFRTSQTLREEYQDNRVFFSARLIPETPIRPDRGVSRQTFNNRVFSGTDMGR